MGKIIRLDEDTINKISAGEVIERPASVVKELIENSIDAEATSIAIEIKDGGKSLISVADNGCGILREDIPVLFERHATSKIKSIDDLSRIRTLGFRGEAMSSIVAVADIELESQSLADTLGTKLVIKSGKIIDKKEISTSPGTIINVKNLFYNTPARLKFMKSDKTELKYISNVVEKIALSNTHISIKYIVNDNTIFHTPGNGDLLSVIQCILGMKAVKMMLPVNFSNNLLSINGYISKPEFNKGNSGQIIFSINNRIVKNSLLKEAAKAAYKTLLMNNRFPIIILNINIDPDKIDVNIHPSKAEVKFSDERSIFNLVYHSIKQVLTENNIMYTGYFTNVNDSSNRIEKPVKEVNIIDNVDNISIFDKKAEYSYNQKLTFNNKHIPGEEKYDIEKEFEKKEKLYNNEVTSGQIIGQLFGTYIVYQLEDSFMIIDQHAAHERILYEELIEKTKHKTMEKQPLLMPIIIELTPKEKNLVERYKNTLLDLGFEIEFFSQNSLAIRQVPIIRGEPCSGFMITDLLEILDSYKDDLTSVFEKSLIQMACKNAVKANKNLTNKEIEELIISLFKSKQPYTCPHGRPTVIIFNKTEIEKKFKRII